MGTDELGMVRTMTVDVILTAPQITAFEEEFFPKNLTVLDTKGDVLTHDGTNEVKKPVGTDGQVLQALASAPDGLVWANGGLELIADESLPMDSSDFDVNFPAREFLYIVIYLKPGTGSLNAEFTFNDDSGPNYAFRRNENFGTITTNTSQSRVQLDANTVAEDLHSTLLVFNQPGIDTAFFQRSVGQQGTTATTLPETQNSDGIWYDAAQVIKLNITTTINQLTDISRVIVYGSKV